MFEAAVTKFAKQVGDDEFIPASSLAEADKCKVLSVVVKKNRKWFWQSAKYYTPGFTLQDIVREKDVVIPIKTTPLMPSYEKTHKLSVKGKLGGKLKEILELEVNGSDSIDLESTFSKVQKTEISAKDALHVIKGIHIDMEHQLVRDTVSHPRKVLCIVSCDVSIGGPGSIRTQYEIKADESIGKPLIVSEDASVDDSSNRSMTLEEGCILAYNVYELQVDVSDGSFELVLDPDAKGGFHGEDTVDCSVQSDVQAKEYEAIVKLNNSEKSALRDAVLGLCAYGSDVDTMLLMLKQAIKGALTSAETQTVQAKFQCEPKYWQHILQVAQFTVNDSTISYPDVDCEEMKSMLTLFEALIEFDDDDELSCFVKLEERDVKPLLELLQASINRPHAQGALKTQSAFATPSATSAAGRQLLEELGFRVEDGGMVQAPSNCAHRPKVQALMKATDALWGEQNGSYCAVL